MVVTTLKMVDAGVKLAIGEFLVGGGGSSLQMNVANGGMGYAGCHEVRRVLDDRRRVRVR